MRKISTIIFIMSFSLVLLSGCTHYASITYHTETESGKIESNEFSGSEIKVEGSNGAINLKTWDKNYVEVVYEKQANSSKTEDLQRLLDRSSVALTESDAQITVKTNIPRFTRGSVSIELTIFAPSDLCLDISTSNGGIDIYDGFEGNVKARTSNGSIKAVNPQGDINLRTSNGKIDMTAAKLSGNDYRLKTSNGAINVSLPKGAAFDLDARTSNGRIRSDFIDVSERVVREKINGGGPKLALETSNGSITIDAK